jgi:hypothetical protein
MSLFPRHLVEGQILSIHLRLSPCEPCFPLLQLRIEDPSGRTVLQSWQQQATWAPLVNTSSHSPTALLPGIYEVPPLLMVADYLRQEVRNQAALVGLLQDIGHSRHWYTHWTIPGAAMAGKYEVKVSAWLDGREYPSPTAADDHFFVERLFVDSVERTSAGLTAHIRNDSPENTKILIHRAARANNSADGRDLCGEVHKQVLPGNAVSALILASESTIVTYAEGSTRLWLQPPEDRPYIRHHACAWAYTHDDAVAIACHRTNKTYALSGSAKQIWLAADGLTPSSLLRALNLPAVEQLLRLELLLPVDPLEQRSASQAQHDVVQALPRPSDPYLVCT